MRGTLSSGKNTAIKGASASGSEMSADDDLEKFTPASGSNPHEWFYAAAQSLLGKDAGYALHVITGYPASTCYAYVTKDAFKRRRPSEHFLRRLFATDHGEPFHTAFMAGCPWWTVRQREAEIGRKVLEITK